MEKCLSGWNDNKKKHENKKTNHKTSRSERSSKVAYQLYDFEF